MNGSTFDGERVTFVADANHQDRFIPQVSSSGAIRVFEAEDITRVLDFEGVPEPPNDGGLMFGEDTADGLKFPVRHFCLRGGYLFYFDVEDVDEQSGPYAIFHSPPLGVVPLDKVIVEFPPGGRRVFREHATTDARTGYEFVILHVPEEEEEGAAGMRPPFFVVADTMGQREKWAKALRLRAEVNKPTMLRAGYSSKATRNKTVTMGQEEKPIATATSTAAVSASTAAAAATTTIESTAKEKAARKSSMKRRETTKAMERQVMDVKDDAELAQAVVEFGSATFSETAWMDNFFQIHNDFDAPSKCRQMEQWQTDMKKNLKGAVLEQYEYFVQASGEMTTMGREVSSLKNLIETQLDTIKDMKEIDFKGAVGSKILDGGGDDEGNLEPPRLDQPAQDEANAGNDDERSIFSEVSSMISSRKGTQKSNESLPVTDEAAEDAPAIDIPEWLEDVTEEIAALAREGRYNDAIELHVKARHEVAELIDKHERPTLYRLTKKQLSDLKALLKELDKVGKRIGGCLEETLRRKNEALRQATKRERTDPNATVTTVSPCALNDDALYLQLLVKLGKTQTAAEAYSARRSLLLLEALSERPISGAGSVDLVIYSAQLSQSFFSCLANSVEGFLDLFLSSVMPLANGENPDTDSLADSSLHSQTMKNAPAGAVASVVLWCDSELSKFAAAFGGTRILANLALSPPPRDGPKKPRVVGESSYEGSKERKNAIDVAAQCIDQAFLYASQNLDSVGLPLAPRLAEYIRARLKGCEDEIAQLLDERWGNLTASWRTTATTVNGNGSMRRTQV